MVVGLLAKMYPDDELPPLPSLSGVGRTLLARLMALPYSNSILLVRVSQSKVTVGGGVEEMEEGKYESVILHLILLPGYTEITKPFIT